MRRIYASPRIENVERLVAVMAEHGIATKVTNRRVYDSRSYRSYSYADPGASENWPSVWVMHANDHTRAREVMREIGIEPETRNAADLAAYRARKQGHRSPAQVASRVRTLILIAVVVAIAIYGSRVISAW